MLKSGANVLLLDEPTNDLDVDTLRAGRGLAGICRMCGGDQPRPLVSDKLPLIFWPLKATAMSNGLRVIIRLMKKIKSAVWAQRPASQCIRYSRFHARKIPPLLLAEEADKKPIGADVWSSQSGYIASISALKSPPLRLISAVFSSCCFQHGNIFNFQINDMNRFVFYRR